jgi:hypothetical protein
MWTHRRGSPDGNQTPESQTRRKRADAAHARQDELDGGGEAVLDERGTRGAHDPAVAECVTAADPADPEIADRGGFGASFSRAFATLTRRAAGVPRPESTGRALESHEGRSRRGLPHRPRWLGPAALSRLTAMLRLPPTTIRSMTAAHDDEGAHRQRAEDAGRRHDELAAGHDKVAEAGIARGDAAVDRLHRYQARIQREAARLARQHAATTAVQRPVAEHEPTEPSDESAPSAERQGNRSRQEPAA